MSMPFFSLYAKYQTEILNKQVERAKKIIANPSSYKKTSINDVKRFIKNIAYDEDGTVIDNSKLLFDEELLAKEKEFIG